MQYLEAVNVSVCIVARKKRIQRIFGSNHIDRKSTPIFPTVNSITLLYWALGPFVIWKQLSFLGRPFYFFKLGLDFREHRTA
jgi:hypothetical protein